MKNLLFSFFLFASAATYGQGNTVHQTLYWVRYYNQTQLSSKYTLHIEVDERRLTNPDLQYQFFSHIHLHRRFSRWIDAAVGFTYASTNSNRNRDLVVPEYRPFQEVSFSKVISKKVQLQFRYRFEQRFIHNNNRLELKDGYVFFLRHRFRIQGTMTLKKFENGKAVIVKASEEIMLDQGAEAANSFDQNRVYFAGEFQFNKKWSVELGYLNLYQSASDGEFFARDILRFTLYHRLSLLR